jgi:hypothetical protein
MKKVKFKHWKTGEELEIIGEQLIFNANGKSDRYIFKKENGTYEDILTTTLISIEDLRDDGDKHDNRI